MKTKISAFAAVGLALCAVTVPLASAEGAVPAARSAQSVLLVDHQKDGWEQDVNARLLHAAEANDLEGVRAALADGAVPDAATFVERTTALVFACRHDNLEMAKLVLDAGADTEAADARGETALFAAVGVADFDLLDLLFFHGAKAQVRDAHGATPLMRAVVSKDDAFLAQKLISQGAHVNSKRLDGRSALMLAVERSHLGVASHLLENRAHHYAKDRHGRTALSIAAELGSAEVISLLLTPKHCTKLNSKDKLGQTPLIWATRGQHYDAAKALVDAGAKIDREDDFGRTAYQWAVFLGNAGLQELLKPTSSESPKVR